MAICTWCSGEMTAVVSCTVLALHREGRSIAMIPWGREVGTSAQGRCYDCGVQPQRFHHPGCDLQECPLCGGQMLSCGCRFDEDGPGEDEIDVEISVPRGRDLGGVVLDRFVDSNGCPAERRRLEGGIEIVVHYDDLPESDHTVVDGIPCTTALRTIIDVAADVDDVQLQRMMRDALARQLFTIEEAEERVAQPDIAQRPGAKRVRETLQRWNGAPGGG